MYQCSQKSVTCSAVNSKPVNRDVSVIRKNVVNDYVIL